MTYILVAFNKERPKLHKNYMVSLSLHWLEICNNITKKMNFLENYDFFYRNMSLLTFHIYSPQNKMAEGGKNHNTGM